MGCYSRISGPASGGAGETWRQMEGLVARGLVRSIGVSNASAARLRELLAAPDLAVAPAVKSQYELERDERIKRNEAFLVSLGLGKDGAAKLKAPKKASAPRTSPRDSPRRRSQQARQHRKAPPLPRLDSGGSLARAVAAGALGDASDTPPPTGYGIWDDAAAAAAAAASQAARQPPARQISQDGLDEALRTQVEYYFSVANLCKDVYLRGCMDGQGFVPLDHVCTFKRLRDLCDDPLVVRRAVESSDRLNLVRFTDESSGANVWKVRTVDQPERWVLAASQP